MVGSIAESNVANSKSIEVLVILRNLQLCMHRGISNLIIENDYRLLVEEISSAETPNSTLGNILLDIKDLMSHFINCKIQYGNRTSNTADHKLVRNVWHVNDIFLWYEEMPLFLEQTIWFDKLNL